MERLIKEGQIIPKHAKQVHRSKIGLGFEKLDRGVFDPEKAYDQVAELGVKWVRIQSGWARTEKERGIYDFAWMDSIIENLIARGLKPWVCLCYGNGLYDERAAEVFGAVGCPPIHTQEQMEAWDRYVRAFVSRYQGRITHYEVWNEPDGIWCWKHGVNATELGNFTVATAKAIKETDADAKVIGGALCMHDIAYLNEALQTGMGKWIDYLSFHEYTADETGVFETVKSLKAMTARYNPAIEIIQGESGSQSRSGGHGALWQGAWTEEKQAKQLARHALADLLANVYFTSYFSCMDMIEALNGQNSNKSSYLDYGYFGVLGAEFDENGMSVGEYYKKKSYFALQNIASVFAEDFELRDLPVMIRPTDSLRVFGRDVKRDQLITGGFGREHGEAFVYWHPSDLMTTSFASTVTMKIYSAYDEVRLIDLMDGSIYEIPDQIMKKNGSGVYTFENLPVKDTPLLITFGKFISQDL